MNDIQVKDVFRLSRTNIEILIKERIYSYIKYIELCIAPLFFSPQNNLEIDVGKYNISIHAGRKKN